MPKGTGFFFHVDGRLIRIWEHATDVRTRSEEFGLSTIAVEGLDPLRDRQALVMMALNTGWVRYRLHRGTASIEFTEDWGTVLRVLLTSRDQLGVGDNTLVTANHLVELRGIQVPFAHIRLAVEQEGIADLLLRAYQIQIKGRDCET